MPVDHRSLPAIIESARVALAVRRKVYELGYGSARRGYVLVAIYLGHMERRPMDAGAIAEMTAMKRTTVLRYLNDLRHDGFIVMDRDGRRVIPAPKLINGESYPLLSGLAQTQLSGYRIVMSKMDT